MSPLQSCGIENLLISESSITDIKGLRDIVTCKNLELYALKKLVTLTSFPLDLETLVVEACNKFNFDGFFDDLTCEYVDIISCKGTVDLSQLLVNSHLKILQLINTPIVYTKGIVVSTSLKQAYIDGLTSGQFKEIIQGCPSLELSGKLYKDRHR